MSLDKIIAEVVKVAKTVAPFIPGGQAGVAAVSFAPQQVRAFDVL